MVSASVIAAFLLVQQGIIDSFLDATSGSLILSSFFAGVFFTSLLTVVPAGVALVAIGQTLNPFVVAFFGALGAMCVDLIVLSFVRKDLSQDVDGLASMTFRRHVIKAFHFGFLKWVAFISGLFLIATPLPDEAGLFLVGISKINPKYLPLVFFSAHFLGILAIVSIATAL